MKQLIYLLLAVGLLTACEKGEPVVPVERPTDRLADVIRIAQEGALMLDDASTRATVARRIDRGHISCKVRPATRAGEADDTLYYVVNYADNAGFAVVSADEEASDGARLIAVTESGSYTAGEKTANDGFNLYMEMVEQSASTRGLELDSTSMIPIPAPRYEEIKTYSSWFGVDPLVTVKWGQGETSTYNPNFPYNKYCYNADNELCPAGCVAVAIAQIMSYHRLPPSYLLTYDGNHRTVPLDWDMLNSYVGGYGCGWTASAGDTIAQWFREIGQRSNMQYYPDSSWTTDQWAREAFASFGYDQFGAIDYSYAKIKSELSAHRPLYIAGARLETDDDGTSELSGHAWVADGYKYRTCQISVYEITPSLTEGELDRRKLISQYTEEYRYVHYNWGYDGTCNGFFKDGVFHLNKADEEAGGYDDPFWNYMDRDYRYNVRIITGIVNNHTY